jgi:selenocysteine-specific elongation factor
MRVIGTAGHVDHGKSSLVQALTGIDPDRLAEEKARQLTIDLGFAWLDMPDGEPVGIVDVPGHEDFIENMLAGVGGIDAALLVVAADEGVMPQTREHLAIIDLLAIPRLLVALTKVDMVEDEEWLELVELDVEETLSQTRYAGVPIVHTSAHTGDGLDRLVAALDAILDELAPHVPDGLPRLPIDRVFTISGFGTVVTGTLLDGSLSLGDDIEVQPAGVQGRIRGLQSHNEEVEVAYPGSRTAINIAGIDKHEIKRGDVLTRPGGIFPSLLLDVEIQHLADSPRPLKHNAEVKFFAGSSEGMARLRLLFDDVLSPGQIGWAQLQLDNPLPVLRGQRFILRIPSPPDTIGGGIILDTAPGRKWRRNRADVQARFERLTSGTPFDLASEALIQARRPLQENEVKKKANVDEAILAEMQASGDIIVRDDWYIHHQTLDEYAGKITRILDKFHSENPLQQGMQANALRSRLRMESDAFDVLLAVLLEAGSIALYQERLVHLPDFNVRYSRNQQAAIERLMAQFNNNPYTPPSVKESIAAVGENVLDALVQQGDLVRLDADVVLTPAVYHEWLAYVYQKLQAGEGVRAADLRDHFNTSRKYVLAFLDFLESRQLTRRVDDAHVLSHGDWTKFLTS